MSLILLLILLYVLAGSMGAMPVATGQEGEGSQD